MRISDWSSDVCSSDLRLFGALAAFAPEALPNTLYTLYEERFGVTVYRAAEQLRAVAADARAAELLELAVGTPLLEIDRLATTLDGVAVEWRVSRCRTDAHRDRKSTRLNSSH